MSEYTYTRSYSAAHNATPPGFASSLKPRQFHTEVIAVLPNLLRIDRTGDVVDVVFSVELSGGEESTLNSKIAIHTPDTTPMSLSVITNSIKNNIISTSNYSVANRLIFNGGTYAKIHCVSYMDSGVTSYSIKVFDVTNSVTVVEQTFTNTTESVQTLGLGTNIPTSKSIWEVQVKKNGGSGNSKAYIDSVQIEYA